MLFKSQNKAIKSSKPGIATNTAAAKAFPDRGGGGYLGRPMARAFGSGLVKFYLAGILLTHARRLRCHDVRSWLIRLSSGRTSTRKPGPAEHKADYREIIAASLTAWQSWGPKWTVQLLTRAPPHPRCYAPAAASKSLANSRYFVAAWVVAFTACGGLGGGPRCARQPA
jgi:hypothetical protein